MNWTLFVIITLAAQVSVCAGELRMVIALRSTTLTEKGYITFDAYLYDDAETQVTAPAPASEFTTFWRVRDLDNVRPQREDSHLVVGTDTIKQYVLGPHRAISCQLGERFAADPGDVVEFYISVERKSKSGSVESIRSNSVMLYRPKESEAQR